MSPRSSRLETPTSRATVQGEDEAPERPLGLQIFRTKSIDKLIAESERPEHALKKTLGPVSLTALGVGAVIGSGIFTVIGTAIGGNPSKLADWKGSPIIDLIL